MLLELLLINEKHLSILCLGLFLHLKYKKVETVNAINLLSLLLLFFTINNSFYILFMP